ncbi:hypothetical protein [Thermanaeromonas sp. C210]|uniref:hypothetical protein n=1 Tax=Thermanaeromonas sp. C210 TaxID=2731925 RepID=UPI00155B67FD|nr:hypothetical protein [Thermanaeromonas sp. C210]GFN23727.1 hypothetical protein TAMC210_20440 [Thermanaeromonas sp. C210]
MNLNMHIILDELKPFNPRAKLDESIELHLKQARIVKELPRLPSKDYLYVLEAETLASGVDTLAAADLCVVCVGPLDDRLSQQLPCNLINIDTSLDVLEVFHMLQDIFEKYSTWNRRMIDAIIQNEPLQTIFDIGATALENHRPVRCLPCAYYDRRKASGELPGYHLGRGNTVRVFPCGKLVFSGAEKDERMGPHQEETVFL